MKDKLVECMADTILYDHYPVDNNVCMQLIRIVLAALTFVVTARAVPLIPCIMLFKTLF